MLLLAQTGFDLCQERIKTGPELGFAKRGKGALRAHGLEARPGRFGEDVGDQSSMTFVERIEDIRQQVEACETVCVTQASNLVRNFRVERISLQKQAFEEARRAGSTRGSHSVGAWCPLNLFSRLHNGSLQTRSTPAKRVRPERGALHGLRHWTCNLDV